MKTSCALPASFVNTSTKQILEAESVDMRARSMSMPFGWRRGWWERHDALQRMPGRVSRRSAFGAAGRDDGQPDAVVACRPGSRGRRPATSGTIRRHSSPTVSWLPEMALGAAPLFGDVRFASTADEIFASRLTQLRHSQALRLYVTWKQIGRSAAPPGPSSRLSRAARTSRTIERQTQQPLVTVSLDLCRCAKGSANCIGRAMMLAANVSGGIGFANR